LRATYTGLIESAFKAGIENAFSFWHMTPREIDGRMKAWSANVQRHREDMDDLAWMIGHYAAWGYHNPKQYPKKPNLISKVNIPDEDDEPMPDESMKAILTGFAEIHNAIEGGK
jgi:hypothetical protein